MKKIFLYFCEFVFRDSDLRPVRCDYCGFVATKRRRKWSILNSPEFGKDPELKLIKRCPKCRRTSE